MADEKNEKRACVVLNGNALHPAKGTASRAQPQARSRDVKRAIWELARLHTREAWLCWYPAGQYFIE